MTAPKHYPEADANGWIALSKRKPTKEDANEQDRVLCVSYTGFWDTVLLEYVNDRHWTHWKPAGDGPVAETEEERQKREDREAFDDACKLWEFNPNARLLRFYGHALAHARKERK